MKINTHNIVLRDTSGKKITGLFSINNILNAIHLEKLKGKVLPLPSGETDDYVTKSQLEN